MMADEQFKDWVQNVEPVLTLGGAWQVRLDGSSVTEGINKYGQKARHSFMIGEGFSSKEEAHAFAVKWLNEQLERLSNVQI